jgi:hypothetical protein
MQQFFDRHLRGAPAPDWMEKGIPYKMKGRDQLTPATPRATSTAGETAKGTRP